MKRVVLSIIILSLCILSIAQVPESFNYQAISRHQSGVRYPTQAMKGIINIPSGNPTGSLILLNGPDYLFGIPVPYGITNRNTDKINIINGSSNNTIIYHPGGDVPDLTEIMGKPYFERITIRGFYIDFTGKPNLFSGNYFVFTNKLVGNYNGVFQDLHGNICTLVPGWKSGQYFPVLNSNVTSFANFRHPEWHYFGTFPSRTKHSSKPGKQF
jgi:hypothetical protein